MQNRRERRKLEKQFGLMKQYQKGSAKTRSEIRERRQEMGRRLHEQHLENIENQQRKDREENEIKIVATLMESGMTEEEAVARLNNNDGISEAREEKLRRRREKRLENKAN